MDTPANALLTPAALGLLYLLAVAWPLARTDVRERRLPNRLVLPSLPITLLGQLLAWQPAQTTQALLVAVIAFGAGLMANRFGSLGMGDVKLIAAIALALGWFSPFAVLVAVTLSFGFGVLAIAISARKLKKEMGRSIALGPYLLVGFASAIGFLAWPAPVLVI